MRNGGGRMAPNLSSADGCPAEAGEQRWLRLDVLSARAALAALPARDDTELA